jgi:F420-0:gamma-glutamyl ligase
MQSKQMDKKETTRLLNNNKELLLIHQKVVDKLEKRIATLEKVLASHAKCIGELRGTESRIHDLISLK